jgi:histidyl-tRNA synthetase
MIINRPRGTKDYIYELDPTFDIICQICHDIAKNHGIYQIKTPIFEYKDLFVRTIGDDSDIVNKEFYEFNDKNDRQMVLRPELTAPICRAIVENDLLKKMQKPIKFFYIEPMFRYERPQSGRLREFHQFGIECIGTSSYMDDVESLIFAYQIINSLGIKHVTLSINNIGNFSSRSK